MSLVVIAVSLRIGHWVRNGLRRRRQCVELHRMLATGLKQKRIQSVSNIEVVASQKSERAASVTASMSNPKPPVIATINRHGDEHAT
ncbi:hypothetical protein ACVWXO_006183 [Bradyrhizobium sp. LM2.7]